MAFYQTQLTFLRSETNFCVAHKAYTWGLGFKHVDRIAKTFHRLIFYKTQHVLMEDAEMNSIHSVQI